MLRLLLEIYDSRRNIVIECIITTLTMQIFIYAIYHEVLTLILLRNNISAMLRAFLVMNNMKCDFSAENYIETAIM